MGLNKIFKYIEETEVTLKGWLFTIVGVVLIRTLLENVVSYEPGSAMVTSFQVLVHLFLFWLTTTVLLMLVVHFTTKKDIVTVSKISLFGMPLIFLAPVIDFLITGGEGAQMTYLFTDELFRNFATFYQYSPLPGVTTGMRIEIALILFGLFMYVLYTGAGWVRSLMCLAGVYIIIFITMALPNFIAYEPTYSSFLLMKQSLFGQSFISPSITFVDSVDSFNRHFDGIMAQVLYLMVVPLIFLAALRWNAGKIWAIIRNSRPEKVFHYFAALTFGILLAYREGVAPPNLNHWMDITTIIILYAAFYFAWMFAVGENDIVDREADAINSSSRPLVSGTVSLQDMKNTNLIFLALALLGTFVIGTEALFLCLVFISVYHIYSCPPLHLKKYAIINSALVALATLSVIMAGFFVFNGIAPMNSFPTEWIVLIIVLFTLFLNIKDVKDVAGDKACGVYTIPVIFGEKLGNLIVWGMMTVGLIIVPVVLGNNLFWAPSIIAAVGSWLILNQKPFNERHFFYLYLPYFIYFVFVYFFN